jgi:hypothetical protein
MNVDSSMTLTLYPGHTIEVGSSSWDDDETSIRCRYDLPNGRFSPHQSSELPLHDLRPMLEVAGRNDLLDPTMCAAIIEALAASIQRQVAVVPAAQAGADSTVAESTVSE